MDDLRPLTYREQSARSSHKVRRQMTPEVVEIINWNIAWNSRRTRAGKIIQKILQERRSDILCLCESHVDFLADQHGIFSEDDYGYPVAPGRRKVALWSRTPWEDISTTLPEAPPGRFVEGTTEIPGFGRLRVLGVCVPWEAAHVSTGHRNRKRWEDHITYLRALKDYLQESPRDVPTVLVGDMNQTLPPFRAPVPARDLLLAIVGRFDLVPTGDPERRSVCHMMLAGGLRARPVLDLPDEDGGVRLSDHRGHVAALRIQ